MTSASKVTVSAIPQGICDLVSTWPCGSSGENCAGATRRTAPRGLPLDPFLVEFHVANLTPSQGERQNGGTQGRFVIKVSDIIFQAVNILLREVSWFKDCQGYI